MIKRTILMARVVAIFVLLTTLVGPIGLVGTASADQGDPRYFSETGFRISDDAFWDYFQKRGGVRTFGYPVSRKFQFFGSEVQIFQRRILQKQANGAVGQLNLLDGGLMPYTSINGAKIPGVDDSLLSSSPEVGSPSYGSQILTWVREHAPESWQGMAVRFYTTFANTVTFRDAYPDGRGDVAWMPGINLEMWGAPTSQPALDPNNHNFAYLRFQRGVMHYDRTTGETQAMLLADYFKSILMGTNLPPDLANDAKDSPFFGQYNNANPNGLNRPDQLPGTNMKDAFEKEAPVVAPAPAPAPAPVPGGFRYGLQAHMVHVGDRGQIYSHTRDLGFSWLKQQIEWKVWEPNPGQVNWSEMDAIVNEARGSGITMLFSVVGAPAWAREPGHDPSVAGPPQDPQTFANFLGAMASRYCNKGLGAIEVWNEQNLHYEWGNRTIDPAAYMALLKPSYTAIKNACPSMIVVSGALTPTGAPAPLAMDDFTYLEGMYQHGLKDYSDAIGVHPSGFNVPPSMDHTQACAYLKQTQSSFMGPCDVPHHSWSFKSTIDGYRNIMVKYGDGDAKLWATEFGWAAGGKYHEAYGYADDNTFDEQAAWTVEAFQYMRNSGFVGAAFLWNLNFRVVADQTEKAQWGIVDSRWQPLPVYHALKSMGK